jgi:hypothetical protein
LGYCPKYLVYYPKIWLNFFLGRCSFRDHHVTTKRAQTRLKCFFRCTVGNSASTSETKKTRSSCQSGIMWDNVG